MTRGELVLLHRALRSRWPIPEELRAQLITEAALLALNRNQDARIRLGAMKVVVEADKLNLAQESIDEQRAERLALEAAQGERDGDIGPAESAAPDRGDAAPAPNGEPPPSGPLPAVQD